MSIATMKVKSYTLYGKSHSTKDGFSINGALRHPAPTLGRSVTRTPFKGPVPKGHGEGSRCRVGGWRARLCGHGYPVNIHYSCLGTRQTETKPSVMNNKGMIETRFIGILHGTYPNSHVYRVDADEMTHIDKIKQACLTCPLAEKSESGLIQDIVTGELTPYIKSETRCTPYTKNVLNQDYKKYYTQLQSSCTQLKPSIYKGLNICQ
jgi:hypothetical protein